MSKLDDDIVVTSVDLDTPPPPNGEDIQVEADGDIQWNGSEKMVILKLGEGDSAAELVLTYDTENQDSATNAAILIASAGTALPILDMEEEEEPEEDHSDHGHVNDYDEATCEALGKVTNG